MADKNNKINDKDLEAVNGGSSADILQRSNNGELSWDSASEVVDAWMNSPTHRDNIVYTDEVKRVKDLYG